MTDRRIVERFGQLFVMAFDGPRAASDTREFLRTFGIGGVILFEDNYESPEQLRSLTATLQRECTDPDTPLLICTDHEGGRVQRFRHGFTAVPPMAELGRGDPADTEAVHAVMGRELRDAGIVMNLAPVADVCPARRPGSIGDRSFGDDPDAAAVHVAAAVRGLAAGGVLSCAKHFPGHGPTTQDGHHELPTSAASWAELDRCDLVPFRAAAAAGVDAVMTAHVLFPDAGDAASPASLSPFWVTEVLRGRLGFDGLVVSDALEMKGIMTRYAPVDSGRLALAAGTDVLLYYKEADQFAAFYELRRSLERDEFDPAPIVASLARVRAAKERWLSRAARP